MCVRPCGITFVVASPAAGATVASAVAAVAAVPAVPAAPLAVVIAAAAASLASPRAGAHTSAVVNVVVLALASPNGDEPS